jgi:hypothetical protein
MIEQSGCDLAEEEEGHVDSKRRNTSEAAANP